MKHNVENIRFAGRYMILRVDSMNYKADLARISPKLAKATKVERETYRVSPTGYGIHWPLLDEDLSVDGLVRASAPRKPEKGEALSARAR